MINKISLKKKWVSTSAWRGYEEPIYAFAGINNTGDWEDSPSPSHLAESSRKKFSNFLKKNKIPFKFVVCKTSNVFASNGFFVTSPDKVAFAKTKTAEYVARTKDRNVWVN